jgi:DegV family protein with EDD domain
MTPPTVAIVTDSTADLPPDVVLHRALSVVPLTVRLDGHDYLDGVDISAADFYSKLQSSSGQATTSQPSPASFAECYSQLLTEHDAVVSIHISAALSGTLGAAQQGAALVDPGRVHVIDSGLVSMPLGLMVLAASTLAQAGGSAAEIRTTLDGLSQATRVYFMVGTLEYLRRGGRIGRASALLGSVLQVKPVLTIADGLVTPLERVRTEERAMARVVELARAADQGKGVCAIVGHAAAESQAERIAAGLEDLCESLLIHPLGPVVGAHAGPGTVGVGCYPAQLAPLGLQLVSRASAS